MEWEISVRCLRRQATLILVGLDRASNPEEPFIAVVRWWRLNPQCHDGLC
ncbi:MAG: hypothetical protein ACYTXI_13875 [Nostoc sp.]